MTEDQLRPLTPKQTLFVAEYLIDLNATQAARRAGYSEDSVKQIGTENLAKPSIALAIKKAMDKRRLQLECDASYVMQELLDMSRMDIKDVLKEDGSVKPVSDWPDVWRLNVSGFEIQELANEDEVLSSVMKKIKHPDRKSVLELLGKHVDINAWTERKDINLNGTIETISATVTTSPLDAATQALIDANNV